MIRAFPVLVLALFLAACGGTPSSSPPADAAEDLAPSGDVTPAPDLPITPDGTAGDAPAPLDAVVEDLAVPVDISLDVVAVPDGRARCTSDAACMGSGDGPVCDLASGRCVPCTPASDRCPTGQYCVAGMNRCAPGCRDDVSCGAGSDGGVTRRCDTATRACVDCVRDEHCAAGTLCVGNVCVPGCSTTRPCPAGQSCCSGACTDTQTNIASCGVCDRRCTVPNATPVCRSGVCGFGSCTAPYGNCDGDAANGCETDTRTSTSACGACGSPCAARPNATTSCEMGTCRYTCMGSFGDCDGNGANGCETDLSTTANHCGMCGRACALLNATAGCNLGACVVASCAAGFGDCNSNPADGCETDLRTSLTHCGGCGRRCAPANATPVCSAASCAVASCAAGFGDCDGSASNGCEGALSSVTNCGACGRTCPAPTGPHVVARCASSGGAFVCGALCESGWTDCDSNIANGCEAFGSCTRPEVLFTENFETALTRWSLAFPWRPYDSFFAGRIPYRGRGSLVATRQSTDPCRTEGYATLTSDIDVSRATALTLQFASYSILGRAEGYGLEVSTDRGASWTDISAFFVFTTSTWDTQTVDLSAFAGRPTLRFRFYYLSLCPGPYFEWNIDELSLQALVRTY